MLHRKILIPALLALSIGRVAAEKFTSPLPGMWSYEAMYLWPGATAIRDLPREGRLIPVPSPNGQYQIIVEDSQLTVRDLRSGSELLPDVGVFSLAEVAWSPDSRAFFINESEGGYVGMWSVRAYVLDGDKFRAMRPGRLAHDHFEKKYCPEGFPNLVAAGWEKGSTQLLLVGEVPDTSSYRNMGFIHGYLVRADDGEIIEQFSDRQLKRKWSKLLGPRLGGSDQRWKDAGAEQEP